MNTSSQHERQSRVSRITDLRERVLDAWGAGRWHLGKGIEAAVTIPLYRLTGWIAEGSGRTPEEDCDAAYQMGFAAGEQPFVRPTRKQMAEGLESLGFEATDEYLAKLGFANYPTAVQR